MRIRQHDLTDVQPAGVANAATTARIPRMRCQRIASLRDRHPERSEGPHIREGITQVWVRLERLRDPSPSGRLGMTGVQDVA